MKKNLLLAFILLFLLIWTLPARASAYTQSERANTPGCIAEDISMSTLLSKYIPKPFNAVIHSDNLEFHGKYKRNVIPEFLKEMQQMGWIELKGNSPSEMKYFTKTIDGTSIRISLIPAERGGPEEENASTFIYFKIIPPDSRR